jgi:cell division protein FtsW (lipid II flippase)
MLAATGIAAVFTVQTLLNVGGVTKAIPITGVTLPFISQGGSSLLVTCIAWVWCWRSPTASRSRCGRCAG